MLDSSIGLVRGDPNRLQQVLWNLLSNAVKFTPSGGRVQHRARTRQLARRDRGGGFRHRHHSPDFLPYRLRSLPPGRSSTTRQHGGLGLGLSIVKNLVELHGGSVRVKSPGENQGSTFSVALPVLHVRSERTRCASSSLGPPIRSSRSSCRGSSGIRALVVDDEPDGAALIARILEGRGAIARRANADAALGVRSQRERFDILLSDIGMPDMDGYELMRLLRKGNTPNKRVAAVAVTAYARPEDRQRSLLAGFQMHLAKPIEALELVAGIASLLQLQR